MTNLIKPFGKRTGRKVLTAEEALEDLARDEAERMRREAEEARREARKREERRQAAPHDIRPATNDRYASDESASLDELIRYRPMPEENIKELIRPRHWLKENIRNYIDSQREYFQKKYSITEKDTSKLLECIIPQHNYKIKKYQEQ
jgi:hypothetical protein